MYYKNQVKYKNLVHMYLFVYYFIVIIKLKKKNISHIKYSEIL